MCLQPGNTDILRATVADAEEMAAIHAAAFAQAEAWSVTVFQLQLALPNVLGLFCRDRGVLLLRVAADEGEILTIGVHPSMRRLGVAGRLLRTAIDSAAFAGAQALFLEVAVTNKAARALYCALGFKIVGLRRRYYTDGIDAVVMKLELFSGS